MELTCHPSYPIEVPLPKGWSAVTGRSDLIPCDTWTLKPRNAVPGDLARPFVNFLLGWIPRPSRLSAGFPGSRADDAHVEYVSLAGRTVRAVIEQNGVHCMVDADMGELALSVRTWSPTQEHAQTTKEILSGIRVDTSFKPRGWPSPQRRAMDLALAYVRKNGLEEVGIFWLPPTRAGEVRTSVIRLGIQHDAGFLDLDVDIGRGSVRELG